jgi:hypothetical protein
VELPDTVWQLHFFPDHHLRILWKRQKAFCPYLIAKKRSAPAGGPHKTLQAIAVGKKAQTAVEEKGTLP